MILDTEVAIPYCIWSIKMAKIILSLASKNKYLPENIQNLFVKVWLASILAPSSAASRSPFEQENSQKKIQKVT